MDSFSFSQLEELELVLASSYVMHVWVFLRSFQEKQLTEKIWGQAAIERRQKAQKSFSIFTAAQL